MDVECFVKVCSLFGLDPFTKIFVFSMGIALEKVGYKVVGSLSSCCLSLHLLLDILVELCDVAVR
jgi:hypothetical protein